MTIVLNSIEQLTAEIRELDHRISSLAGTRHPQTRVLRQSAGVGPLPVLCFVLTIESPSRFTPSREVGAYLGLVPKQRDLGDRQPQLGISMSGDVMPRRLLVGSAHDILGPFGPDSDLRAFGLKLSATGGLAARNRAGIAVTRKLAILLHPLWVTGEAYQPTGDSRRAPQLTAEPSLPHRKDEVKSTTRTSDGPPSLREDYGGQGHEHSNRQRLTPSLRRQRDAVSHRLRRTLYGPPSPSVRWQRPPPHRQHHPPAQQRRATENANRTAVDIVPQPSAAEYPARKKEQQTNGYGSGPVVTPT